MIEFTFDSLFRTTNKGLPDTSNLPPYSYITMNHFVFSLIVEIILGLVITMLTALAVYRAFYKIKNPKFNTQQQSIQNEQNQQDEQKQQQNEKDEKNENGQQASQTNDNLIYRFDQDESEKDSKEEKKSQEQDDDQQKKQNDQQQEQQEQVSQQTTQWFLDLDHKMLFLQPFLISFAIVVNIFASNIIVLLLLGLALIFFYLFNIKGYCARKPILQIVFTLPCIVVLFMVYVEDRDMST